MRKLRVYEEAWPLHTPFVIARGSRSEAKVVVVEMEEDGVKGANARLIRAMGEHRVGDGADHGDRRAD
jgi:L-alanine-DL-glutamate epimerase-like enolase superfamily enzyme